MRHREVGGDANRGCGLAGHRPQKPESRRRTGEELGHRDLGPGRSRCDPTRQHVAVSNVQRRGAVGASGSCGHAQLRHRRDAGQCLATKPERADSCDVISAGDLRRGVTLDRELDVVALDAGAVVHDGDPDEATPLDEDVDPRRAGIEGVLDKLLHDRCGSLDHLAGRDRVRDDLGQPADGRGRDHRVARSWSSASLFSAASGVIASRSSPASSLITGCGPRRRDARGSADRSPAPRRSPAAGCAPGPRATAARGPRRRRGYPRGLATWTPYERSAPPGDDPVQERDVGAVLDDLDASVAHPRS